MINQLRQTVEELKSRVQRNLDIIHRNEKIVKKLLEEPVSNERSRKLEAKYQENKKLLQENNDSIKLQLQLSKFIDSYKNEIEENEGSLPYKTQEETEAPLTREDIFNLTIKKEIEFDENHPYFNDEKFFNDLIDYFTSVEDYEMCSFLLNNKQKMQNKEGA
jgi:hypothetical protein